MLRKFAIALAALTVSASMSLAAPITTGNVVVYRVGDGTGALQLAGNKVFLDEFTPSGTKVQSFDTGIYATGTSSAEGYISLSTDGTYVVFAGYKTTNSAASGLNGTKPSSASAGAGDVIPRIIGRLNVTTGVIEKKELTTEATTALQPRSVVASGNQVWLATSQGVRTIDFSSAATATTAVNTTITAVRTVTIANGQLYEVVQSGTSRVLQVGTNLPTSTATATVLSGIASNNLTPSGSTSPQNIFFADSKTLYIADDGSYTGTTFGGVSILPGIQKYVLSGGSWVYKGFVAASGVRGLTGTVNTATGTVSLFGSTSVNPDPEGFGASFGGGTLFSLTDSSYATSSLSGSADTILSVVASSTGPVTPYYTFRGIAYVPEPSALGMLVPAGMMLARRRRA